MNAPRYRERESRALSVPPKLCFWAPVAAFVFGLSVSLTGGTRSSAESSLTVSGDGGVWGASEVKKIGARLGFAGIPDSKNEANARDIIRFSNDRVHALETSAV